MKKIFVLSEIKICTKCGKELSPTTEYFYKRKDGKFDLHSWCVECYREYNKQQYEEKKDYILKKRKKYLQSEKGKIYQKKYWGSKNSKASKRKYQQSEKGKNTDKEYRQSENGRKVQKRYRESENGRKGRKKFYEKNKLSLNMSSAIYQSLEGNKAGQHWEMLVPYTIEELKRHLENLFQPGMTWENHTLDGWHIDHKTPISSFNIVSYDCEDFKRCWALNNLQPLWAEENLRKHNKLVW